MLPIQFSLGYRVRISFELNMFGDDVLSLAVQTMAAINIPHLGIRLLSCLSNPLRCTSSLTV